jgi:hypothetical protein
MKGIYKSDEVEIIKIFIDPTKNEIIGAINMISKSKR